MTDAKRCDITGEYWDVFEEEETKDFLTARPGENEGEVEIMDVHPKIYSKIVRILADAKRKKKRDPCAGARRSFGGCRGSCS